ncbi:DUF3558 domain-containing protein [Amycolatopsis sp. NPDC059027]|uniref:DUF3558 domain-containing protein n=1 Tax=unclassified Amycolatopsis TaxID=2618356 RepID=UPI003673086C
MATARRHGLWLAGGVLVTATLAGCSSSTDGTPYPVETAASSLAQRAKAAELPARPKDLPVKGVDPCSLLSQPQLAQLKITGAPRPAADQPDGPTCVLDAKDTEPFFAYHVRTIGADVSEWLTGARRKNSMTTQPNPVGGFPAITNFRAAGTPADCETLVGVASGQTLVVQAFAISAGAFTQPRLCEMSAQAADLALQTLKARN